MEFMAYTKRVWAMSNLIPSIASKDDHRRSTDLLDNRLRRRAKGKEESSPSVLRNNGAF